MLRLGLTLLIAALLPGPGLGFVPVGPAQTYALCQLYTPVPTEGCPAGTLYVSQTDPRADFTSVQAAI